MSEHVHVHAPHELTESGDPSTTRSMRITVLVLATLMLIYGTVQIATLPTL